MGYDVHITRAADWADNDGFEIPAEEWLRLVGQDPELELDPRNGPYFASWNGGPDPGASWLDWSGGDVFTKNPGPELLAKMESLADRLGARVQGDEGESYRGGEPPEDPPEEVPAGLLDRIRETLFPATRRRPLETGPRTSGPPFAVGDRVRDAWANEATVTAIDLGSNHGLGAITLRYDDGRTVSVAASAHGLRKAG